MKKILFAAALFVAASANSFGAPCTNFNGSAISALTACEIGNGGTLWQLSNFTLFANTGNGVNIGDMTAANLLVNFQELSNGFSVSYSTQGGFTYTGTQANQWGNGMWITAIGAASPSNTINGVTASYMEGSGNQTNFTFRKNVQDQLGGGLGTVFVSANTLSPSNNQSISGNFGTSLSVNDRVVFDAGGTGGGTILSYTNTFTSDIPEPMSFVLMGCGLIGIAALRRRAS